MVVSCAASRAVAGNATMAAIMIKTEPLDFEYGDAGGDGTAFVIDEDTYVVLPTDADDVTDGDINETGLAIGEPYSLVNADQLDSDLTGADSLLAKEDSSLLDQACVQLSSPSGISTQNATKYAVSVFKDFCVGKSYSPAAVDELTSSCLQALLTSFYQEVRTGRGALYTKKSLQCIRHGLQRHFLNLGTGIDIVKDEEFKDANVIFATVCKDPARNNTAQSVQIQKPLLIKSDIKKIETYFLDYDKSNKKLQQKIFYDFITFLGFKGREALRHVSTEVFIVRQDDTGQKYVLLTDGTNYLGDLISGWKEDDTADVSGAVMFERPGDPLCPVKAFELYVSKLNPCCNAFFQYPRDTYSRTDGVWFENRPVGKNNLGQMMQVISKEAELSQIYTNYSIRVTCLNVLGEFGFTPFSAAISSKYADFATLKRQIADTVAEELGYTSGSTCRTNGEEYRAPPTPPVKTPTAAIEKRTSSNKKRKSDTPVRRTPTKKNKVEIVTCDTPDSDYEYNVYAPLEQPSSQQQIIASIAEHEAINGHNSDDSLTPLTEFQPSPITTLQPLREERISSTSKIMTPLAIGSQSAKSLLKAKFRSRANPTLHRHLSTAPGMDLKEVVNCLETYAPSSLSEDWDNVGLLVEPSAPHTVRKMLLTNDLTEPVLDEAISAKCDMILSYHPPIFAPLKRLTQSSVKERIIVKCIENRLAVYSPHTAYDALDKGVNKWLISAFSVKSSRPIKQSESSTHHCTGEFRLEAWADASGSSTLRNELKTVTGTDVMCQNKIKSNGSDVVKLSMNCTENMLSKAVQCLRLSNTSVSRSMEIFQLKKPPMPDFGMGQVGELNQDVSLRMMVEKVKTHLKIPHVRLAIGTGLDMDSLVSSVAVCAGSGASVLKGTPADLYLTGEMSHHDVLDAVSKGISVILCDHSNTERGYLHVLSKNLQEVFYGCVQTVVSTVDADPLNVV
ncbi:uncharacterized protein LOC141912582 [Tubulanus polymorphus]|uniref:uncharacterized protein LOC141912582 n=1 Tax=Tubulanus polymorphus TaxID=672921 RepID=UPI003DA6A451